ncbi:hypothetical protein BHE74_00003002 [Ensete ventricosum]|nr:hypothetical protein GW17_00039142 [Ensete ventricosum]RWW88132.1 hypothetical protein BHE74_00003002 [Ensete ventricosum]RZR77038.1 hypothetical protein BHM03_00002005 [Ensete ventricosum]
MAEGTLLEGDVGNIVSDRSRGFGRKQCWRGKRPMVAVVGKATEASTVVEEGTTTKAAVIDGATVGWGAGETLQQR